MSNSDLVQVCVRTRPLTDAERQHKKVVFCDRRHCRVEAPGRSARSFLFTHCFEEDASQEQVFAQCGVTRQVERSLDGYASLIFAFGQTGAGKTYTMFSAMGDDGVQWDTDQSGLIPRAMVYLFHLIDERQAQAPVKYNVRASFLEIYNEQVCDLLRLGPPLKVHWKEQLGFFAENHVVVECSGADDAIAVVNEGVKNRKVGSHNLNSESSRSHSIFMVDVDCFNADENGERYVQSGRLLFVDLAGSEKLKQTGSAGEVMHEAKNINKSLLTLGKVISTLSRMHKGKGKKGDKGTMRGKGMGDSGRQYLQQHVPFRDSALTKLLMQSFVGNSYVLMVCCCAPTIRSADETLATLRYASRAMDIEVNPGARVSLMGEKNSQQQQQQIDMLKEEIRKLTNENRRLQQVASNSQPSSPHFSPKSANRLTPPPYSSNFLPMIHSPSPSHTSLPLSHLSLNGRVSPTTLSPMGSPTRNSPLLQMYQQNQQQQQFLNEEPPGYEDLRRQLARLEMLLSEMTVQNSHLKAENSQLFAVCEQTKSEYTRLLHKLDTMEAIFFRQGELPLPWSASRILPEPPKSEAFLKKVKSLTAAAYKPLSTHGTLNKPPSANALEKLDSYKLEKPPSTEELEKLPEKPPTRLEKPASGLEKPPNGLENEKESFAALEKPTSSNELETGLLEKSASPDGLEKAPVSPEDVPQQTESVEKLEDASPISTKERKPPNSTSRIKKPGSGRKSGASPDPVQKHSIKPDSARKRTASPDVTRIPTAAQDATRKSTVSDAARKTMASPDLVPSHAFDSQNSQNSYESPNSLDSRDLIDTRDASDFLDASEDREISRKSSGLEYALQEEDIIEPLAISNQDE